MVKKNYEELRFTDDFMFCKILQNDPELCRELLERLLNRRVGRLVITERQHAVEITPQGRGVRFDVYAVDDESVIYDVEMQNVNEGNLPERARYAQAMLDMEQLERGKEVGTLKKSIVIFLCRFNIFPEVGLHRYVFQTRCEEQLELKLGDGMEKVFICTRGSADDLTTEDRKMLDYIEEGEVSDELTEKIDDAVQQAHYNPRWRMMYHDLQQIIEREKSELQEELEQERAKAERERAIAEQEKARADALEEELRKLKAQLDR